MDKHSLSISSSKASSATIDQGSGMYWCPTCNKVCDVDLREDCVTCHKEAREIQNPKFQPSVFPSFSSDQIQILDTPYELILVVPGKGQSLQFHLSLQRHYYPYLDTSKGRDVNSVICKSVKLSELQKDMYDLGCCLPDLDWFTPPKKGASFLMKTKSQRVYKFDSLQNTAKHCFVVAGPGVLCDMDRAPFNLLVENRKAETKNLNTRLFKQWYKACLDIYMDPEDILQLVGAACGSTKWVEPIAKEFTVKKKSSRKDDDDFLMNMQPGMKSNFDFGPTSKSSSSGSDGEDSGWDSDSF
jgi:hypothetical protein